MPVKKCILMLCVLLALVSPAAAFVQGDEQFFYSSDMMDEINKNLGDSSNPSFKYTAVTNPSIVLNDVSAVFPSCLAGMSFVASYTPEGKTAVYPGILTLQFTREEILAFPKGSVVMSELEASQTPAEVLFKYFDPVFVVYGADGSKISINVKNYPFNFSFVPGDFSVMSLSFPVVFADGYPETFCIETIGGYAAVYDAVVSETNSGKIGDGKIEVSFGLVPNERATGSAVSDYSVLEAYGDKGYVVFDDCSEHLGTVELSGFSPAKIYSGSATFSQTDGGFSFSVPYSNRPGASLVTVYVRLSEAPSVFKVNGYSLPFQSTELPDGFVHAYSSFVLADGTFVSEVLMNGDMPVVFDGSEDGVLAASVSVEDTASAGFFYHGHGSFEVIPKEGFSGLSSGEFTQAVLPLLEGMSLQISPVRFEGAVGPGKSVYGMYEFVVRKDDFPSLKNPASPTDIFNYVRPVLFAGDVGFDLYDYLTVNGRTDLLSVSGSLQAGFSVKVPVAISDREPAGVSLSADSLVIYDGLKDGKVSLSSYIGGLRSSSGGNSSLLTSSGLSLKKANIDIGSFYDIEETEADFDWTGQTDWPGKEGVLDAVSVGSFVGTYDGSGKYSSLKVEVSVSAADLKKLSADRYKKVCASWTEDRMKFLDYYHVYKQIGNSVYDLVLLGGKSAFTVAGDPTARVVVSFNAVLIDDVGTPVFDDNLQCFIIYDGAKDGNLTDPLFVGTPESVPEDTSETPEDTETETKPILPDNPEGPSSGHDNLGKWISIISIF